MSPEELKKLVEKGENESLELKAAVPPAQDIARHLAAFANTDGGVLVIGVKEPAQAVGVNQRKAMALIGSAERYLSPSVPVKVESLELDGHRVVVASVKRSDHLVGAAGGYYRRKGDRFSPITAEHIHAWATRAAGSDRALADLSAAVANQTETIDQLRQEVATANSIPRRWGTAIFGAVIGAELKWAADNWL